MPKEIIGSISYKLTIDDKQEWLIEYESTVENDMAAIAISQYVMESVAVGMKHQKQNSTGRMKKSLGVRLDKVIQARFGLKLICDYLLGAYEGYMEHLAKKDSTTIPPDDINAMSLTEKEVFKKEDKNEL